MPRNRKSRRKGYLQANPWLPRTTLSSQTKTKQTEDTATDPNTNRFPILLLLPKEILILVILIGNLKRKDCCSLSQTCVRLHDVLADESLRQRVQQHFETRRFSLSSPKKILQYLKTSLGTYPFSLSSGPVFYQRHFRADHNKGQDCRECSSENCYIGVISLRREFLTNEILFAKTFELSSRDHYWSHLNTNELTGYIDTVGVNVWQSLNDLWHAVNPNYLPVRHWGTRLKIRPMVLEGLRKIPNVSANLQFDSNIRMFPTRSVYYSLPGLPLSDCRDLTIGSYETQNWIVWLALNTSFRYAIYSPAMQLIDESWNLDRF